MTGRQVAVIAAAASAVMGAIAGALHLKRRSHDNRERPERDDVHHPV